MPTTNHTSRAPNRNIRAADNRFTSRDFDQTSRKLASFLPAGRPGGRNRATASRIAASTPAIARTAGTNPTSPSSTVPSRNPIPLTAFFDPVRAATQRNSVPSVSGASTLTADFDDILAKSLATPDRPCTAMTKMTDAVTPQAGSRNARAPSAAICRASPE